MRTPGIFTSCSIFALLGSATFLATAQAAPSSQAKRQGKPSVHSQAADAPRDKAAPAAQAGLTLVPDPAIRYGRLANGMRYALRYNKEPSGAFLRLRFGVGSLHEQEDQLGLAHFMEHMVFNGTRNVPEGEMVRRLERHGLRFGADTNATTDFHETIYKLDLPDTTAPVVDTALFLMREVASEATLDPAAIERERGVVLSEERAGGGAGFRTVIEALNFWGKGQLLGKRLPIGTVDVLKTAKREQFLRLYQGYYRPENAILVMIGSFDVDEMERKIKARFSDWRGVGPAGPEPQIGAVTKRGLEAATYAERGVPSTISIQWNKDLDRTPDSVSKRRREMLEALALNVFNRRLALLTMTETPPPFVKAQAAGEKVYESFRTASVSMQINPGEWRRALAATQRELRRMQAFGITQSELDRQIDDYRANLKAAVAAEGTRDSRFMVNEILNSVSEDKVVSTPSERLRRFEAYVAGLKVEEVSSAFNTLYSGEGPLIFVTDAQPIAGGEAAITNAFLENTKLAISAPVAPTRKDWSYTNFGKPGTVAERREIPDLKTTFVRFSNGVRLAVRPSSWAQNKVQVSVRVFGGQAQLPADRASALWLAREGFIEGGLGKFDIFELDDALAEKFYGLNMAVEEGSVVMFGAPTKSDVNTQMQVFAAYLSDPAFRTQAVERTKSTQPGLDKAMRTIAGQVLQREMPNLLHPGDRRFGLPSLEERMATGIGDVRNALSSLQTGPIEVVIVGDISVDEAIAQTAATLGALPPRPDRPVPAMAPTTTLVPTDKPIRLTHQGRKDQGIAVMVWRTNDYFANLRETIALNVLQRILTLRLTDEIRERQATTYSPIVAHGSSKVFAGKGHMLVGLEAPAAKHGAFFSDAAKIVRSLREKPPTQDEFDRAVRPYLQSMEHARETNPYWTEVLAGAQTDPRQINAIRSSLPTLRQLTPADITHVAAKYLQEGKALRVVVVPE